MSLQPEEESYKNKIITRTSIFYYNFKNVMLDRFCYLIKYASMRLAAVLRETHIAWAWKQIKLNQTSSCALAF